MKILVCDKIRFAPCYYLQEIVNDSTAVFESGHTWQVLESQNRAELTIEEENTPAGVLITKKLAVAIENSEVINAALRLDGVFYLTFTDSTEAIWGSLESPVLNEKITRDGDISIITFIRQEAG